VDEQDPTTFLSVIDQEDDRDTKNHTLLLINTFCFCDIFLIHFFEVVNKKKIHLPENTMCVLSPFFFFFYVTSFRSTIRTGIKH